MKMSYSLGTAVVLMAALSGCGSGDSKIAPLPMPQNGNNSGNAQMRIRDRTDFGLLRAILPDDGQCRIRLASDPSRARGGYVVFSGKNPVHGGAYASLAMAFGMQRSAIRSGLCSTIAPSTCDLEYGGRGAAARGYLPTIDGLPMSPSGMSSVMSAAMLKRSLEMNGICVQRISTNCRSVYDDATRGYLVIRDGYPMDEANWLSENEALLRALVSEGYCAR